ncbi:GNAT family N-acetyltransferase [Yoonia maritima]|uniref:GNAT family N-acetyltransferase n=1 Tax=Yoonia maritima TaxID=1435347 RepID=UPI000D105923|nr:GNAT family N-acetyltransferase [Yoonia maritima]
MHNLTYRDLRLEDTDALHAIVSDWDVVRQMGSWPWPPQYRFTESRCTTYKGAGFVWGLFAPELIGMVAVTEGELGYLLAREYWGKGIVTAMARTAINHGFRDPALLEVTASIWGDNHGSGRVLAKLGFVKTHDGTEHALARDEKTTSHYYSLSRDVWHRLRCDAQ